MTAVSLRLPDDVSQRLRQLAARTGRSRTFYIRFLTQMCARFSPSRSAAPWEEGADALVPANQR